MLRYKKFILVESKDLKGEQIEQVINSKNGSIFHDLELNRIIEEIYKTKLYYLVDDPVDIKEAANVHVISKKFGLKQYFFRPLNDIPYSGFIGNPDIDINDIKVNYFESFSYYGFPYSKEVLEDSSGQTVMVDLSLSESDIFNHFIHSKRRNMIRRAIKEGINIKAYSDTEGLDIFWPMLNNLHRKLGYGNLIYEYYHKIIQKFGQRQQAFILVAYKKDKPISGVFIIGNKNYMHYFKGASFTGVKNEGQGELLQWESIKLSKILGASKYDLCNLNKEKLNDIYIFKTGFSREFYYYQKYVYKPFGYKIINRILN